MSTADVYKVFGRTAYWEREIRWIPGQGMNPRQRLTVIIPETERALNSDVKVVSPNYNKRALQGQNKSLDTEYDNIMYNMVHAVMAR